MSDNKMAMVDVGTSSLQADSLPKTPQLAWLSPRVGSRLMLFMNP